MAIKRRATKVPPETPYASTVEDDHTKGRSNMLQGLRLDVYNFVKINGPCTRDDISKGLSLKSSTATARVKELLDDGFFMEPSGMRKLTRSGVKARCLVVSDRAQSGSEPLDKVLVEVTLTIDRNGVYGAAAHVVGGAIQTGASTTLTSKRIRIPAPHPDTVSAPAEDATVTKVSRADTLRNLDDIIDADYTEVDD